MDTLDFTIYRFLSPGGEARFWAGRRMIDPTIPVREIAERVGISENGVRTRMRSLNARGYLRGVAVTPNPSLFGMQVWTLELPVKGIGEVERIYHDLSLVDGVLFARDTLDEGERRLRVHFIADGEATAVRRSKLLQRLAPEAGSARPERYWIPPCEVEATPLDWRLLQSLRRHPEASVAETARAVGVSLKTTARRCRRLIDARGFWYTHGPEAEEFPLALIRVEVRESADRERLATEIAREPHSWMPVARDGSGLDPGAGTVEIAGLVPADAPVALERTVQTLGGRPEVARVRRTFALGSRTFPAWFDDQLDRQVPPVGRPSPTKSKRSPRHRKAGAA
jgi:DNA-binding Lrp family transcriptional regulator